MTELRTVLARVDAGPMGSGNVDLSTAMRWTHVPGLSVALVRAGSVTDTLVAGVRAYDRPDPVTTDTPFQAGSVAKSVTAAVVLRLVAAGRLDLDRDVDEVLRSWRVPATGSWRPRLTLRQLLSHTAGVNVPGVPGHPHGGPVPTVRAAVDGLADIPPVRVTGVPGTHHRYSGGGYAIIQILLCDVVGADFPQLAHDLVLEPLGLTRTTFAEPDGATDVAYGHRLGPALVAGGFHAYPALAAAGLWSTPTDIARFYLAIRRSLGGDTTFLPPDLSRAMTTALPDAPYGLGVELAEPEQPPRIGHGGVTEGFQTHAEIDLETGDGFVAMANGDWGDKLIGGLLRPAIAATLGWSDASHPEAVPLATGRYESAFGDVHIEAGPVVRIAGQPPIRLLGTEAGWGAEVLSLTVRRDATDPDVLVIDQHGTGLFRARLASTDPPR